MSPYAAVYGTRLERQRHLLSRKAYCIVQTFSLTARYTVVLKDCYSPVCLVFPTLVWMVINMALVFVGSYLVTFHAVSIAPYPTNVALYTSSESVLCLPLSCQESGDGRM